MSNLYESDMLSIQKLLNFLGDEANGYRRCYKKYRKEAGMTQEEMANRLGVTTPAVNKWENSNSKPDIELLAPIARLLDIVCAGKDVEGTYKVVKHFLDNVGTMYDFRKSGLYKHMKFRDIDEAILDGVKNFLKDSEMRKNSATWQDMNRGRN